LKKQGFDDHRTYALTDLTKDVLWILSLVGRIIPDNLPTINKVFSSEEP
jgi:hypothetical protein